MTEPTIMLLLVSGPGGWMLGGYRWKGWRRIVWPTLAAGLLAVSGIFWLKAVAIGGLLAFANTLPYGDRTPWALRAGVFAAYALPSWLLTILWWPPLVLAGVLTLLMAATRWKPYLTWKLWEGAAGFLQAATLVIAVLHA